MEYPSLTYAMLVLVSPKSTTQVELNPTENAEQTLST
jgi:hypothetical protein